MKCKKCGASLQKGELYCSQCGTKIEKSGNKIIALLVMILCILLIAIVVIGIRKNQTGQDSAGMTETMTEESDANTQELMSGMITFYIQETATRNMLSDVKVEVREGIDNTDGGKVCEEVSDDEGKVQFELPNGEYTIKWGKDGYYQGSKNISVNGKNSIYTGRIVGPVTNDKIYILIEWKADTDIDCCLYNASTKEVIDMLSPKDSMGSFIYSDGSGSDSYEMLSVNYMKNSSPYTLFIKDYKGFHQGSGTNISSDSITVSVYNYQGLIYSATAEPDQNAAIWSPFYIYQGEVEELNDYLTDTAQYPWLANDKNNPDSAVNISVDDRAQDNEVNKQESVQTETRKGYKEVFANILRDQNTYQKYYTSHSIWCTSYLYGSGMDDDGKLFFAVLDLNQDGNQELMLARDYNILNVLSYDEKSGILSDMFYIFDDLSSNNVDLMDNLYFTTNGFAYSTNCVSSLYTVFWKINPTGIFWGGFEREQEYGIEGSDGSFYEYGDFTNQLGDTIDYTWYMATASNIKEVLQ